jgi:hypothetical protein
MAIGVDNRLKSNVYKKGSPLDPPDAPKGKGRSFAPQIADSAVSDQANNILASSAGGSRMAMQGMDRAGVSRGRGQQYRADYAQAAGDTQARLGAAQTAMGAASANAQARQAYQSERDALGMNSAGLLESLRSSSASQGMARRGMEQDTMETMARNRFGLDSIQLDTSPLLQKLLTRM